MKLTLQTLRKIIKEELNEMGEVSPASTILDAEITDATRATLERAFESVQYSTHILYVLKDWLSSIGDTQGANLIQSILDDFVNNEATMI